MVNKKKIGNYFKQNKNILHIKKQVMNKNIFLFTTFVFHVIADAIV